MSQAVYSKFNILVVSGVPHCVTDSLWFGFISKLPTIKYEMLLMLLLSQLTQTKESTTKEAVSGLLALKYSGHDGAALLTSYH